jgi:MOSC domain-containing protein YiiM
MVAVSEARAVPGRGLEGDRYFNQAGTFWKPQPDYELTLIEIEALEGLQREFGVELEAGDGRRNVVTRGVSLNDLVGQEFQVGEVRLRGIRLCEPCSHLAKLSHRAVLRGLVHRGGLRAQILTEGKIHVGDAVE